MVKCEDTWRIIRQETEKEVEGLWTDNNKNNKKRSNYLLLQKKNKLKPKGTNDNSNS